MLQLKSHCSDPAWTIHVNNYYYLKMFLCIELLLSMGTRVTIGSSNVTTDNSSQSRALSFLGTANIQQFLRDYWKMILLSCYYSIWLLQKAREVGLSPEPDVTIFGNITLQFAGKIWWEPSTCHAFSLSPRWGFSKPKGKDSKLAS